jgi:ZIP family zinc transporter
MHEHGLHAQLSMHAYPVLLALCCCYLQGVAVALPVYFATGSRWRGLQTAVLSGLAEPLAVILLGLVLPFMELNKHVVDGMLAGVGGIMAFLAFHELLPLALQHAGKPLAVGCLFGGMGLMSLTLYYLNNHLLAGMH